VVAVIVSRDASVGEACAAQLAGLLGSPDQVVQVAGAAAIDSVAGDVDVLVTVPALPIPGAATQHDQTAFLSEVQAAVGAVLPAMVARGRGRVVLVVTATGLPGQTWSDGTGVAMGAMVGLARTAAREVAASGVTVNVVRAGVVDDDASRSAAAADDAVRDAIAATQRLAPIRRPVVPDDIAAAVAYLASDDASYVTGIVLPVDGGLTIGQGT
jgi:NAD(P)-dependent dehydrogenase (short-subunit alcohol dehydrogenase family)